MYSLFWFYYWLYNWSETSICVVCLFFCFVCWFFIVHRVIDSLGFGYAKTTLVDSISKVGKCVIVFSTFHSACKRIYKFISVCYLVAFVNPLFFVVVVVLFISDAVQYQASEKTWQGWQFVFCWNGICVFVCAQRTT